MNDAAKTLGPAAPADTKSPGTGDASPDDAEPLVLEDGVPEDDPLAECLAFLTRYYGRAYTPEQLRAGLPLEVTKEFEGWRQVRDSEGTTGWIAQSFLSGRRTAMVLPWERKPDRPAPRVPLWSSSRSGAPVVVEVEAGVIANIMACDGDWCEVTIEDYRGFVEQKKLWGVYQGEKIR